MFDALKWLDKKSDNFFDNGARIYDFMFERPKVYDNKLSEKDLELPVKRTNPYGFAYSYKRKQDIELNQFDYNKHFVIIGKTGHGKNVAIDNLIEKKMKEGDSVIFIDPKGDPSAMHGFETMAKYYGRKHYILSEFKNNRQGGNPIFTGTVQSITERIFDMFDWDNPYYRDINFSVLNSAVKYIKAQHLPMSLNEIQKVLREKFTPKDKSKSKKSSDLDDVSDLLTKLDQLNTSIYAPLINEVESPVTVDRVRDEGACLYVSLSTLGHPKISKQIGKLFMQEVMYHCYVQYGSDKEGVKKWKNNLFVVFDEFGSIAVPTAGELIDKSRGAGVSLCLAFQGLSNLVLVSPTFAENIMTNIDNFLFGHTNEPDNAEKMSLYIGTSETTNLTRQMEFESETGLGSVRDVREYLAHPDIFKKLRIGQYVTLSKQPHFCVDLIKFYMIDFVGMNKHIRSNIPKVKEEKIDFVNSELKIESTAAEMREILNKAKINRAKKETRTKFVLNEEA